VTRGIARRGSALIQGGERRRLAKCPELNAIENVWQFMRNNWLSNRVFRSYEDAAIAAWRAEPRTTPGGQPSYSALAIATALTLRAVFHLALRQTEGLIGSIIRLLGWTSVSIPLPGPCGACH
jgi:hypothetical protein